MSKRRINQINSDMTVLEGRRGVPYLFELPLVEPKMVSIGIELLSRHPLLV